MSFRVRARGWSWPANFGQRNGEAHDHPATVHDINVAGQWWPPRATRASLQDCKKKLPKTSPARPQLAIADYFEAKTLKTGDLELVLDKPLAKKRNGS